MLIPYEWTVYQLRKKLNMQNSTRGSINKADVYHILRHTGYVALGAVVLDLLSSVSSLPAVDGWQAVAVTLTTAILVSLKSLLSNYSAV